MTISIIVLSIFVIIWYYWPVNTSSGADSSATSASELEKQRNRHDFNMAAEKKMQEGKVMFDNAQKASAETQAKLDDEFWGVFKDQKLHMKQVHDNENLYEQTHEEQEDEFQRLSDLITHKEKFEKKAEKAKNV
jgi:hypothetical protein